MTAAAKEIAPRKRIALVAHDNRKQDLLEWSACKRRLPDYQVHLERFQRPAGE